MEKLKLYSSPLKLGTKEYAGFRLLTAFVDEDWEDWGVSIDDSDSWK